MFNGYLLLAFLFMGLLFVRHILIFRQENKINYAPLIIAIGAISSIVHFITYPENKDFILLLRESLFPFIVSLFLYIVMNILHQTQNVQHSILQNELTNDLISQISELKSFTVELEKEMFSKQKEEIQAQKELRDKFNEDIKSLEIIQQNQVKFLAKFDDMSIWHKDVSNRFNDFTEIQLPALDGIVHKHIDILRVAEQDHFNKVKNILEQSLNNKCDIEEKVTQVNEKLDKIKDMPIDISESIISHLLSQLSDITKAFEGQIISLKSHTEGINTDLYESETSLDDIKNKSEMIVKQMAISSKTIQTLQAQSDKLYDTYLIMNELINNVTLIKSDYEKTKKDLSNILEELRDAEAKNIIDMKKQIESVSDVLTKKIDDSLQKLHEHYHVTTNDVSQSLQMLSQKNKLKGYVK